MATTKKITMREFNGTDYDTLYPKTDVNQVENLTPAAIGAYPNGIKGAVNCNNLSDGAWTISASATNGPGAFACTLFHKDWNVDFASQIAFGADHNVYYRVKTARSWIDWQEMYSTLRYPSPVKTGSYVGTGTYGPDNPNSLTLPFEPKLLMIAPAAYGIDFEDTNTSTFFYESAIWFAGTTKLGYRDSATHYDIAYCTFSVSGNKISWYSNTANGLASTQLNTAGTKYAYIAIG